MKKRIFPALCAALLLLGITACTTAAPAATQTTTQAATAAPAAASPYRDGAHEYKSGNDAEGYFVQGTLTISGGKIASAQWAIYDANRSNKLFDDKYEAVFSGNETYMQQCRDNLKGMAGYSARLVETQNIEDVDAVTGATWAFGKFKQFVTGAMKNAAAGGK